MNRLLSFILIILVVAVGVGFFRGWFSMSTNKEVIGNKLDVNFKLDADKMKKDANALEEKTKALLSSEKNDTPDIPANTLPR